MDKKIQDNVDIVVAHYNEDLDWVKPYSKNLIIYHKGTEDSPKVKCKKRIKIKNVGREWETYLQHIINNYDNLADITIFFQWWIMDHLEQCLVYKDIQKYLNEVKKYWFSTSRTDFLIRRNPQIKRYGKFLEMLQKWTMQKAELSFSEFYEKIFKRKQPFILPFFYAANFAVDKETIQKNSKEFYELIHWYFINHSNPEEWHYLERLWFRIFNHHLNFHYLLKIILNPFIWLLAGWRKKIMH